MPLRFALIGCGRIAQRYGALLSGEIAGASLVCACDPDSKRAVAFGQKFRIPVFADMHQMAREQAIDVFCVLTPSGLHARHVIELARYQKPIVCEKPMALTIDQAQVMVSTCAEAGCPLFVVKQNRYNLPVLKLREALEQGRFGRLTMGTVRVRWCRTQAYYAQDAWRGTFALDGGVLANQASHHIDLLEWMMGPVATVQARGKRFLADIETEDTAVAMLDFESGALGVIEATTAIRPLDVEGSLTIMGEKGFVEIGGFAVNKVRVWQFSDKTEADDQVLTSYSENPPDVYGFGHRRYLEGVVGAIGGNAQPVVGGHDGLKSVRLLSALYESMATGVAVSLAGFCGGVSRLGRPE